MTDPSPHSADPAQDMDRIRHDVVGGAMQLAHLAVQSAELAVELAVRRARRAEQHSRVAAAAAAERLQADRHLAALVWARSRSERWIKRADFDELISVWASARAWAPYDTRAAQAAETLAGRVAGLGVKVEPPPAPNRDEAQTVRRMLAAGDHASLATSRRIAAEGFPQPVTTALAARSRSGPAAGAHVARAPANRRPPDRSVDTRGRT